MTIVARTAAWSTGPGQPQPAHREGAGHHLGVPQFHHRQVDAHHQVRPPGGLAPPGEPARRLRHHPGADRDDRPALLGQRHELLRGDRPEPGVRPPQQRLEGRHAAGVHADEGLVGERELPAREGAGQLRPQRQVLQGAAGGLVVEQGQPAAPAALRVVHGGVGVAQQLLAGAPPG
jgi:hypothetical protein